METKTRAHFQLSIITAMIGENLGEEKDLVPWKEWVLDSDWINGK
jgi:hypothetical protein